MSTITTLAMAYSKYERLRYRRDCGADNQLEVHAAHDAMIAAIRGVMVEEGARLDLLSAVRRWVDARGEQRKLKDELSTLEDALCGAIVALDIAEGSDG